MDGHAADVKRAYCNTKGFFGTPCTCKNQFSFPHIHTKTYPRSVLHFQASTIPSEIVLTSIIRTPSASMADSATRLLQLFKIYIEPSPFLHIGRVSKWGRRATGRTQYICAPLCILGKSLHLLASPKARCNVCLLLFHLSTRPWQERKSSN